MFLFMGIACRTQLSGQREREWETTADAMKKVQQKADGTIARLEVTENFNVNDQ